jgi:hypothetical protein
VPVVIDQLSLSGDPASNATSSPEEPPGTAPMNEDDFRFYYGSVIRTILREEIERAIRHRAD